MRKEIENYLREDARFRERKNKNKGIANLVSKKYGIVIPQDKRDVIIADILGADRYWRLLLSEYKELRGSDYGTKDILEQKKEIELGYSPGYQKDIKQTR